MSGVFGVKTGAAACATALLLLAACDSAKEEPAPPIDEPPPAAQTDTGPFSHALNFDCEGGAKLDVAMQNGGETVLIRVDGGAAVELSRQPPPEEGVSYSGDGPPPAMETWKAGDTTLVFNILGDASYASGGAPKACTFVARALPAPRIDGVDIYVQGSQAGSTLDVASGESFAITLSGVPTAGYMWGVEALPPFLEKTGESGGSTSTAQMMPGFTGGNHWEVLVFKANAAGTGELVLVQRRPWEDTGSPDDQRFKLTVRAQ